MAEFPPFKTRNRQQDIFIQHLCASVDQWQREWENVERLKEQYDAILKAAYDLCDSLGIAPSANPGKNQMTFYRGGKIIYGYRPMRKKKVKP